MATPISLNTNPTFLQLSGTIDSSDIPAFVGLPYILDIEFNPLASPVCLPRADMPNFTVNPSSTLTIGGLVVPGSGQMAFNTFDDGFGVCSALSYAPGSGTFFGAFDFPAPIFGEQIDEAFFNGSFSPGGVPTFTPGPGGIVSLSGSNFGISGAGQWTVLNQTPVPEPTSLGLLAIGLAGAVVRLTSSRRTRPVRTNAVDRASSL
jgi:hypothetical protein